MAVNLVGSTNGRVVCANPNNPASRTGITIAVTLKPTATLTTDRRIVYRWGGSASTQAFVLGTTSTDELYLIVTDGGGVNYYGRITTALNLASGTTYHIVARWLGNGVGGPAIKIFVNNADIGLDAPFFSASFASYNGSAFPVGVGHEADEGLDGVDGDHSEWAWWSVGLDDATCLDLSNGRYPGCYPTNGWIYVKMTNNTDTTDQWGNATGGNAPVYTAASDATHPTMLACAGSAVFRRTLSQLGTRIGARQIHGGR